MFAYIAKEQESILFIYAICSILPALFLTIGDAINSNHTFFYANNFVIKISLLQIDEGNLLEAIGVVSKSLVLQISYTTERR